jgi:hypothetical protein
MRPKIYGVQPKENRLVHVFFDDGYVRIYDANMLIHRGGIFQRLNDDVIFYERCTVMNGTLAWDLTGKRDPEECIDICPDTIYEKCPIVPQDQIA